MKVRLQPKLKILRVGLVGQDLDPVQSDLDQDPDPVHLNLEELLVQDLGLDHNQGRVHPNPEDQGLDQAPDQVLNPDLAQGQDLVANLETISEKPKNEWFVKPLAATTKAAVTMKKPRKNVKELFPEVQPQTLQTLKKIRKKANLKKEVPKKELNKCYPMTHPTMKVSTQLTKEVLDKVNSSLIST